MVVEGVVESLTEPLGGSVAIPARLGISVEYRDGEMYLQCNPRAEVLRHGAIRASVALFMMVVAAGIGLDDDPDTWTLTSDVSVRVRPLLAPKCIHTRSTILRRGQQSATATADLVTDEGESVASGAISFIRVPRRTTDPPKPEVSPETFANLFDHSIVLTDPLREQAGITVKDPMQGEVQMEVVPELCNPAGTLHAAMVALVLEAAAEELVSSRFKIPAMVTDLDVRYLAQSREGTVRTRCRLLGDGPAAPIQVELFDTSRDRLTALAYTRNATISG